MGTPYFWSEWRDLNSRLPLAVPEMRFPSLSLGAFRPLRLSFARCFRHRRRSQGKPDPGVKRQLEILPQNEKREMDKSPSLFSWSEWRDFELTAS